METFQCMGCGAFAKLSYGPPHKPRELRAAFDTRAEANAAQRGCAKCAHLRRYFRQDDLMWHCAECDVVLPMLDPMRVPEGAVPAPGGVPKVAGCPHLRTRYSGLHDEYQCLACGKFLGTDPRYRPDPHDAAAAGDTAGARFVADLTPYGKVLGFREWNGLIIVAAEAGVFHLVNHPAGPYLERINTAPPPLNE